MTQHATRSGRNIRTAAQARSAFIEFFRARGHGVVPSSPVVPHDDPTLLFANAGMNQFKPVFLGTVDPTSPLHGLTRAVNSQKCIRAGGKHNDLDDVGKDTYHHTFFEMLGNWSFGDYFKDEAIAWAWEFLTDVCGLPADRLYATYFGGDPKAGLAPDDEAKQFWLRHLPPDRVLPFGMKDNFWEMGETGPCGPCSEIHFDRIGGRDASGLVNLGDPDVIEVWNLVFIQYDRQGDGTLRPLPARHVDTGMGLERLVSVLQHKPSNYDTDVFLPIFAAIERITGARPYRGKLGAEDPQGMDTAYRVIADHIRTLTFAITDGAVPSNDGRGYVLRRVLRRAVRYGRQMLGAKTGFFSRLVPVVVEHFGEAFPELRTNPARVEEIIREEEESFGRTLDRGIKHFEEAWGGAGWGSYIQAINDDDAELVQFYEKQAVETGAAKVESGKISISTSAVPLIDWRAAPKGRFLEITGKTAFMLYDTYGFPLDLTQQMAEERGLSVDVEGFERCMEEQRERSRAGAKGDEEQRIVLDAEAIARLGALRVKPTDDSAKFEGRDARGHIRAIYNGANFDERVQAINAGTRMVGVILDRTNHYAEMGGQVGDTGRIVVAHESRSSANDRHHGGEFRVEDTQVFGGYVVHVGRVVKGEVRVGDEIRVHLDRGRRECIQANHTATHVMNFGLRRVRGQGCDQKGSLVAPDRLRFDFAHNGPVSPEQLGEVERIVRHQIQQNLTVYAAPASLNVARQITGLRAVFGEVYPDPVRVVSVGEPVEDLIASPESDAWGEMSVEFCGGTHVGATGEIDAFAIVAEEGIAKGIRRVVAVTGVPARAAVEAADQLDNRIRLASSLSEADLAAEVNAILGDIDSMTLPVSRKHELREDLGGLQERVKQAKKRAAAARAETAIAEARTIAASAKTGLERIIVASIGAGSDRGALQSAMKVVQDSCPEAAAMLFSADEEEGQVAVMATVPKTMIEQGLRAGDWVREAAGVLGGKGGGRPDSAQGGGADVGRLRDAVKAARAFAHGKVT